MSETDFLHAAEHKAEMRQKMRHERRLLSADQRNTFSWQIANHIRSLVAEHQPEILGIYLPLNEEPNLTKLAEDIWNDEDIHTALALPRVAAKGQPLVFNEWKKGAKLDHDKMGLSCANGTEVEPAMLIMPCLAFDARGYRLGYGGGYFDMTLRALERPTITIISAFSVQEVDEIPNEYHDQPADFIATEEGLFEAHRRR